MWSEFPGHNGVELVWPWRPGPEWKKGLLRTFQSKISHELIAPVQGVLCEWSMQKINANNKQSVFWCLVCGGWDLPSGKEEMHTCHCLGTHCYQHSWAGLSLCYSGESLPPPAPEGEVKRQLFLLPFNFPFYPCPWGAPKATAASSLLPSTAQTRREAKQKEVVWGLWKVEGAPPWLAAQRGGQQGDPCLWVPGNRLRQGLESGGPHGPHCKAPMRILGFSASSTQSRHGSETLNGPIVSECCIRHSQELESDRHLSGHGPQTHCLAGRVV